MRSVEALTLFDALISILELRPYHAYNSARTLLYSSSLPPTSMSLARLTRFSRLPNLSPSRPLLRTLATAPSRPFSTSRLVAIGLASATLAGAALYAHKNGPVIHADSESHSQAGRTSETDNIPLSELVRAYIVYSLCSVPFLVDWSPTILSTFMATPGLKQITEAIVRVTFFDQVSICPLTRRCSHLARRAYMLG